MSAQSYTYNFDSPAGALGTSQTYYSVGGPSVTAYGWDVLVMPAQLYGNNTGIPSTSGLGSVEALGNGIDNYTFIGIDMANIWALSPASLELTLGVAPGLNSFYIDGGSSINNIPSARLSYTISESGNIKTVDFTTIPTNYQYIVIAGGNGVSYLGTLTYGVEVPEPTTFLLLGSIFGLVAFAKLKHDQLRALG